MLQKILDNDLFEMRNKLVVDKMKDGTETGVDAIKEFVRLNPNMYSFLVYDDSEHKKAKGVNENFVEKITYNEYKDVLLNNEYLRNSMNRIQSKNHRLGTYETNKISLFCFDGLQLFKKAFLSSYFVKLLLIFGLTRTVPFSFFLVYIK